MREFIRHFIREDQGSWRCVEPAELKALADLPSKEGLRAQLVGALQGPLSQLVSLLAAPQRELVRILEARSKQTEATKS